MLIIQSKMSLSKSSLLLWLPLVAMI